jgi:hypothetical protein
MPGQVSDFWGFELPILAVVPARLPLSYGLKPKNVARRVYDMQVKYPFSDGEAPEGAGGRIAHFNPEVHPNLLG